MTKELVALRKVEVLTVKMEPSHPCSQRGPPSHSSPEPMVTPDSAATANGSVVSTPTIPSFLSEPSLSERGEEIHRSDANPSASSGFAPETSNGCQLGPATLARPEDTVPAICLALPPQSNATRWPASQSYFDSLNRLEEEWNAHKRPLHYDVMSADTTYPFSMSFTEADELTKKMEHSLLEQQAPGQAPSEEPKSKLTDPAGRHFRVCRACRGGGDVPDEPEWYLGGRHGAEGAASIPWTDFPAKRKDITLSWSRTEMEMLGHDAAQRGTRAVRTFHRPSHSRDWPVDKLDDVSNPAVARADGFAPNPPVMPGPEGPPSHLESKPSEPLELDASASERISRALEHLEAKLILLESRLDDMD
jgi:hypothetical protein